MGDQEDSKLRPECLAGATRPASIETIRYGRLMLVPLSLVDAPEMVHLLADPELYTFTGGQPPDLETLQQRYARQIAGPGRGPEEVWYNWIVRLLHCETALGFVQATVTANDSEGNRAELAWLIGSRYQGEGYASQAVEMMEGWLIAQGATHLIAHIHPAHRASQFVATSIELARSGEVDEEGEEVWERLV